MSNSVYKMQRSLQRFNRDLEKVRKRYPTRMSDIQKKLVLEALKRIVERTPVDTGRARGNWQVTIGTPANGKLDALDKDGQATIEKGIAVLSGLPPYQIVFLSNNLEYIEILEEGNSQQAPNGMVRLTVLELEGNIRQILHFPHWK